MLLVLSIAHSVLLLCSTALDASGTRDHECCCGYSPNPNILQTSIALVRFSAPTFVSILFIKLISLITSGHSLGDQASLRKHDIITVYKLFVLQYH